MVYKERMIKKQQKIISDWIIFSEWLDKLRYYLLELDHDIYTPDELKTICHDFKVMLKSSDKKNIFFKSTRMSEYVKQVSALRY